MKNATVSRCLEMFGVISFTKGKNGNREKTPETCCNGVGLAALFMMCFGSQAKVRRAEEERLEEEQRLREEEAREQEARAEEERAAEEAHFQMPNASKRVVDWLCTAGMGHDMT